jgi:hypothetical protein
MREPNDLLAHLEGKLTQEEKDLLHLMRAWAEGSSEVSEDEIRARLQDVPLPRWDLLEAVIQIRSTTAHQELKARLEASRAPRRVYEAATAKLQKIIQRLR